MPLTVRNTHRDIAYFFVGLIISFAISGIALNHRRIWNPSDYTYSLQEIMIPVPLGKEAFIHDNDAFVVNFTRAQHITGEFRRKWVVDDKLRISYTNQDVEIDLKTGKGKIETYRKRPLLGQMVDLHGDTSNWWIYYSDCFGIAMLTLAITGMFIQKGDTSFSARGWKLALAGITFPLIFLFFLS